MKRKIRSYSACLFLPAIISLVMYYKLATNMNKQPLQKSTDAVITFRSNLENKTSKLKTILLWTSPENEPFASMGNGTLGFIDRKCPHTNCFVTSNRRLMNVENFDVVAFNGPDVIKLMQRDLPYERSMKQKYVFVSIDPASKHPIRSPWLDEYFNWTWTYKLDSQIQFGFINVRLKNGKVVGPKKRMNWLQPNDMDPVPKKLRVKLKMKTKAVAWVFSNCSTNYDGVLVARFLHSQLELYNLTLDIFGVNCGSTCKVCWDTIKRDYYFYLSFEDTNSDDYVTETLTDAIRSDAVPVVYGGADYRRFMPDGMYLNAMEFDMTKLAAKIHELIKHPNKYYEYFKWTNHYDFHLTSQRVDTNEYCKMCELLNDENMMKKTTIYRSIRDYWNEVPIYTNEDI